MTSARARFFSILALAASVAAGVTACGGFGPVQTCGEIPQGGCPLGRGGTCDDSLCAALYDCVDGDWSLATECEQGSGGTTSTGGGGVGGAGEGGCSVPAIDHAAEVSGCTPDLQEPDCPAVAAESCTACLTGCVDFYLCVAAGWDLVAFCSDDGALVVTQGRGP